jgi:hypothetical protein
MESDSLAHTLYREVMLSANGGDSTDMHQDTTLQILTFRRKQDGWWIALDRSPFEVEEPQPSRSGAAGAVAAAFTAQDSTDIGQLVRLIDPMEAQRFKRRLIDGHLFEDYVSPAYPPLTTPAAPTKKHLSVPQMVLHVSSPAALDSLDAAVILLRWLTFTTLQRTKSYPGYTPPRQRRTVLGEVMESDTVTYVLFRTDVSAGGDSGAPIKARSTTDVITVFLTTAGWRLGLNGGLVYNTWGGGYGVGWREEDIPEEVQ